MRRLTSTADAWTAVATVGALVLSVALPVSTLVTFGFYPGGYYDTLVPRWQVVVASLLVAVMVPLHLRHVWHGCATRCRRTGFPPSRSCWPHWWPGSWSSGTSGRSWPRC